MAKNFFVLLLILVSTLLRAELQIETSLKGEVAPIGKEIRFKAEGAPEGSAYELNVNGKRIYGGTYTGDVSYTPENSEWITFSVTAPKEEEQEKAFKKEIGFIVGPEKISPASRVPADLEKFWAKAKADVQKFPAGKPTLEKMRDYPAAEGKYAVTLYKFEIKVDGGKYGSTDGVMADGYLAVPTDKKGKLPAVVTFYGAGSFGADPRDALNYAQDGAIGVSMNPHAIPMKLTQKDERDKFIEENVNIGGENYRMRGIKGGPEKVYFVGMFKRVYQTLRMAMAVKEWDGKNLAVRGFSQGGAQALAAAYLCPEVTVAAPLCPALCDNTAALIGRRSGWPDWIRQNGTDTEAKNAVYFDPALMAPKIKAKLYLGIGMLDNTCTPTAVSAMYNSYSGPKSVLYMQGIGHGWNDEWSRTEREFILKNIGLEK